MSTKEETIEIASARYVTVELSSKVTGLSTKSIRNRIDRNLWAEGVHYIRRDGRIFIDMKGFEKWVVGQKD
jgi:hypothetical protein